MKRSSKVMKAATQSFETVPEKKSKPTGASKPFRELLHKSWADELQKELSAPYFQKLETFVEARRSQNKVFPAAADVFSWSHFCPLDSVRVVIIGQDPYHDDNQAHGLCFSVNKGIAVPPSLKNIYKELASNYPGQFKDPGHGNLSSWANQGVLLLNAVLTVDAHKANSHKGNGWEKFTDAVIRLVSNKCENVVYLLWGSPAQKKAESVNTVKNLVLKAAHPSPLSAHKGFLGCGHFKKANDFLTKKGLAPIDWCKFD